MQQQNRIAQYRFQEEYLERLREQQIAIDRDLNHNWYNDPYFYSAPIYSYSYGGGYYEINQYGADMLRGALDRGYEEGFRAGIADREDRWRPDYRDNFAYQDALWGYNGYYINSDEYQYYFRQGFERGYEDGFNQRFQYGYYSNGSYGLLSNVLGAILNLRYLH